MADLPNPADDLGALDQLLSAQRELYEKHSKLGVELMELQRQVIGLRNRIVHRPDGSGALHSFDAESTDKESSPRGGRPVRAIILDLLHDLEIPAYSRVLSQLSGAIYGREIQAVRFGSLGTDERKAYTARPNARSVWLGSALTHQRFEPIRRLWVRSDWPLERRIAAPLTSRVNHLRTTVRLCEWALSRDNIANPAMLKIIAADHARDVEGVSVNKGSFELELWRQAALASLSTYEKADADQRMDAAERLQDYPEMVQLFGRPDVIDGPALRALPDRREGAQ